MVLAWAIMFPPIGFFWSAGAPGALSTEATTWLVTTTAIPNCRVKARPVCGVLRGRRRRWRATHLIGETEQAAKELGEMHLTGAELSTSTEVGTIERSDRVYDEEGEPVTQQEGGQSPPNRAISALDQNSPRLGHHRTSLDEELRLVVGVVGPSVRDVVEDVLSVHAVALGDGEEADGTESALGVDVEALALSSLHVDREL